MWETWGCLGRRGDGAGGGPGGQQLGLARAEWATGAPQSTRRRTERAARRRADGGVRGGDETGGWFRGRHLDGKETLYAGVSLGEVLRAAGVRFDPGMAGLRETVSAAVLVEGADGYRVVFALAELDPALNEGRVILLADTRDGQPLGTNAGGPLRLVVPAEERPVRWVR